MNILIPIFLRYLLVPLFVLISMIILSNLSKKRGEILKMKTLIVVVLITAILLATPSLLGMLKYKFIWEGLILTILIYLMFGFFYNWFTGTKLFRRINIRSSVGILIVSFICVALGTWIYYFGFAYFSKLSYPHWAMLSVLWFIVPVLLKITLNTYIKIPQPFYASWSLQSTAEHRSYWEHVDTFRLMQIQVRIKRNPSDNYFSSFSVKIPDDVSLGVWFNKFVEDQNVRFPNEPIVTNIVEEGWIFYTSKWLPFPMFTRVLDFDKNIQENKIKRKNTIFIKRVAKDENNEI